VASDPTLSRTIHRLADDVDAVLPAIDRARALARASAWGKAGKDAPDHRVDARRPLIIDVDATLVTAHSDKEQARPTNKRGFGFRPLCAFANQPRALATGRADPPSSAPVRRRAMLTIR